MSAKNLMTTSMLAKELNAGSATVRFWLNRFHKWLPHTSEGGEKLYHADTLKILLFISEKINSGMFPTEIEKSLDEVNNFAKSQITSRQPDIPAIQSAFQETPNFPTATNELQNHESIKLITSLFEKFHSQQERLVAAEERKAKAEEEKAKAEHQKAEALAKRAEAESNKANAMNNLADALKNISDGFFKVFSERVFSPPPPFGFPNTVDDDINKQSDPTYSVDNYTPDESSEIPLNIMDDLSALIEDEDVQDILHDFPKSEIDELNDLDDLSALIEEELDHSSKSTKDNEIDGSNKL
ncbi:MAG: MerR family transcriptional regulator, partial [Desulfamplus sp.]|nr:MerR family transcriptional regulator [Desulfamplus sp.]